MEWAGLWGTSPSLAIREECVYLAGNGENGAGRRESHSLEPETPSARALGWAGWLQGRAFSVRGLQPVTCVTNNSSHWVSRGFTLIHLTNI